MRKLRLVKKTSNRTSTQRASKKSRSNNKNNNVTMLHPRKSKMSSRIREMFTLSKRGLHNFSTNFEYGNFSFNIRSTHKDGEVTLFLKIDSKNFKFSGNMLVNERTFNELQRVFSHLLANMRKAA